MSHEKDIYCGAAIVPYAPACMPVLDWPVASFSAGWGLPGGNRTQSQDVAQTVARNMAEVLA
jgi:hypothetical protein